MFSFVIMLFKIIFITLFSTQVLPYNVSAHSLELFGLSSESITGLLSAKSSCSATRTTSFAVCEPTSHLDYGSTGTSKPVNLQLTRGMNSGTVFNIVASVKKTAEFNLKDNNGNILLHVIAHIDINNFHFNTNHSGSKASSWGIKETLPQMPIKSGIKFNLLIAYESNGYHIYVDGEVVYFFKHRIHSPITVFESKGGQIYSVAYKQNEPKWAVQQQQPIHGLYVKEFENRKNFPEEIKFQGCNTLSWVIITGIVNNYADNFTINLVSSSGDNVLHLNSRLDKNCVVCNSEIGNVWGEEERTIGMPFKKNQKFVLAIEVEADNYRIYVNGDEFITYNHRIPVNCVTKLVVKREVSITKLMYHK